MSNGAELCGLVSLPTICRCRRSGPLFAFLVTGTFIVEQIFAIPGMGRYFVTSITNRDYPVVMGTILLYALVLVLAHLAVVITYAFLLPRIRYS